MTSYGSGSPDPIGRGDSVVQSSSVSHPEGYEAPEVSEKSSSADVARDRILERCASITRSLSENPENSKMLESHLRMVRSIVEMMKSEGLV